MEPDCSSCTERVYGPRNAGLRQLLTVQKGNRYSLWKAGQRSKFCWSILEDTLSCFGKSQHRYPCPLANHVGCFYLSSGRYICDRELVNTSRWSTVSRLRETRCRRPSGSVTQCICVPTALWFYETYRFRTGFCVFPETRANPIARFNRRLRYLFMGCFDFIIVEAFYEAEFWPDSVKCG